MNTYTMATKPQQNYCLATLCLATDSYMYMVWKDVTFQMGFPILFIKNFFALQG